MYVSNETKGPLGVDGVIILRPLEENRFVPDTQDYTERVQRLVNAKLARVSMEEGLTKYGEDSKATESVGEEVKVEAPVEAPVAEEAPATVEEVIPEANGDEPEKKKTTSKQRR